MQYIGDVVYEGWYGDGIEGVVEASELGYAWTLRDWNKGDHRAHQIAGGECCSIQDAVEEMERVTP